MWGQCCMIIVVIKIIVALAFILAYYLASWRIPNLESDKCPYCYGESLCKAIEDNDIVLRHSTPFYIIVNMFTTKNVYYGDYNNVNVVLKKLGRKQELESLDFRICHMTNQTKDDCKISADIADNSDYKEKILALLMETEYDETKSFKVCSSRAADQLFKSFLLLRNNSVKKEVFLKNVWTILQMNIEPLLIQMLESARNKYIPNYYGACGRFIVEENRGMRLNNMTDNDWMDRAYLAVQLLQAAESFTFDHRDFRFYLTDVSPDNINVDDIFKVTFIDLKHVVILDVNHTSTETFHKSELLNDIDAFAFSADELCNNMLSDHNYYFVCKNLLSRNAPWPMMKNGLLHSSPSHISRKYPELFDLIEKCVDPGHNGNRIGISKEIVNILNAILDENTSHKVSDA